MQVMGKKPSRHPRHRRGNDEDVHLEDRGVDPNGLRRDLVLTHRQESPPMGGFDESVGRQHAKAQDEDHQESRGGTGNANETPGATHRLDIQDDDPDDLTEPQGHDGQIIPFQSKGRKANQISHQSAHQGRRHQGDQERRLVPQEGPVESGEQEHVHRSRCVGPHRHETGGSQRELAGEPIHPVERHRQDGVDGAIDHELGKIIGQHNGQPLGRRRDYDKEEEVKDIFFHWPHFASMFFFNRLTVSLMSWFVVVSIP